MWNNSTAISYGCRLKLWNAGLQTVRQFLQIDLLANLYVVDKGVITGNIL